MALDLFVFLVRGHNNFYLFCARQIGDPVPSGNQAALSLTEITDHCPETETSQLATNLLPAFSSKHLEETPSPWLIVTQQRHFSEPL